MTGQAPEPTRAPLRRLWEGWKRIARRIGDVQARIMLTIFYAVVVTPFALAVGALSDPMRFVSPPAWLAREPTSMDAATYARRQY